MFEKIKYFCQHEFYYYINRLVKNKKYYIIRRGNMGAGFFSNYWWVMGHVVFAKKLGYIPVVDMYNYKTLYSEAEDVYGEKNAWNYYFENIEEVDLEEIYHDKKYVLGEDIPLHKYSNKYCGETYRWPSKKTVDFYFPMVTKYIRIKEEILKQMEEEWIKQKADDKIILGVHIRGTDMKNNLGHPMPSSVEKYIMCCRNVVAKYNIQQIFLATDEKSIVDQFEKAFWNSGIKIWENEVFRSDKQESNKKQIGIHEQKIENVRKFHKYKMGLEVLRDAYFLSKCDYLVCGHSNITNVAIIWNNNNYKQVICLEGEKIIK